MQSTLSWLDARETVILAESHGKWSSADLLELAKELQEASPDVVVWDPTNIILDPEMLATRIEDTSFERQQTFQIMTEILSRKDEARMIIVRRRPLPVFEALQELYEAKNMAHKLFFCASREEALKMIEA